MLNAIRGYLAVVMLTGGLAYSVPAPTEYTLDMLEQDLGNAHLVVCCEVVGIDTVDSGLQRIQTVQYKVLKCYKGGIDPADSGLVSMRYLDMVGGYGQYYEEGLSSIICFYDGYRDGVHLQVNARGKFDLAENDSVVPPPVGMGFSDEFNYYRTVSMFEDLVISTIKGHEGLELIPVLPGEEDDVRLKTWIDLSGGATLDNVVMTSHADSNRIDLFLYYTPCTGVCPDIFLIEDTMVSAGRLEAGAWSVYRYKINTLVNEGLSRPDDTLHFNVYPATGTRDCILGGGALDGVVCGPNPASGRVAIDVPDAIGKTFLEVYNTDGRRISVTDKPYLDAAGWAEGEYLIIIRYAGGYTVRKLLVRAE